MTFPSSGFNLYVVLTDADNYLNDFETNNQQPQKQQYFVILFEWSISAFSESSDFYSGRF